MERPGHLGPRQVPRENRPPGLDQMQGSVHGERRILVCLQLCWIKITANSWESTKYFVEHQGKEDGQTKDVNDIESPLLLPNGHLAQDSRSQSLLLFPKQTPSPGLRISQYLKLEH